VPAASVLAQEFDAWHPGVLSRIPGEIRHLATVYRPENVFTAVAAAEELADLTGLDPSELVAFRPQRLALHELLIRVSADLSIPDGEKIEDLGINFRRTVNTILSRYIAPEQAAIDASYDALRRSLAAIIDKELAVLFPPPAEGATPASRSAAKGCASSSNPREAKPMRLRNPSPRAKATSSRPGRKARAAAPIPSERRHVALLHGWRPRSSFATAASGAVARPSRRSPSISPPTPTGAKSSGARSSR